MLGNSESHTDAQHKMHAHVRPEKTLGFHLGLIPKHSASLTKSWRRAQAQRQLSKTGRWESSSCSRKSLSKHQLRDFPGSPVVKTPCFHSRGHGLIPGRGSRIPHAAAKKKKRKTKQQRQQNPPPAEHKPWNRTSGITLSRNTVFAIAVWENH